jgi:hypothetical protein
MCTSGRPYPKYKKLEAPIEEQHTYVRRNRNEIPDHAKDFWRGQTISTEPIHSLVNSLLDKRFAKDQKVADILPAERSVGGSIWRATKARAHLK